MCALPRALPWRLPRPQLGPWRVQPGRSRGGKAHNAATCPIDRWTPRSDGVRHMPGLVCGATICGEAVLCEQQRLLALLRLLTSPAARSAVLLSLPTYGLTCLGI